MSKKNVCIIGAGLSGLCAIKELMECGHNVTCYEASSGIGGAFSVDPNSNKLYDSLQLTVSNFFMAYSGFPIDKYEKRRYWTAQEYQEYLESYVAHFHLSNKIKLNTQVQKIDKQGGTYLVQYQKPDGMSSELRFDAVVICTGTNRVPHIPDVPGASDFKGEILHTDDFSVPEPFVGKRVVCVGLGESSADVVHDIAGVTDKCTLLIRSKPSIVARWINTETNDAYTSIAFDALGRSGMNAFMYLKAKWALMTKPNLTATQKLQYQWQLDNPGFMNRFLTKNDVFMKDIVDGTLKVKSAQISRINENSVELSDGSKIDADVIIFNTGYRQEFSIIDSLYKPDNFRDLYKHMIHPEFGASLAFIGWARPSQGGVPSISEMQARYLGLLLNGKKQLPEKVTLVQLIERDKAQEEYFFRNSPQLSSLIDYHQYMKSLSGLIGCKPDVNPLLSPVLAYKMWFGCHFSLFYRLNGPGENRKESIDLIKKLPVASSLIRNLSITVLSLFYRIKPGR